MDPQVIALRTAAISMLEALIYVHNLSNLNHAATEQVEAAIAAGQKALTLTAAEADLLIQQQLS